MTGTQLTVFGQVTLPRFFVFIIGACLFICGLPVGGGIQCLQCATFLHEDCMSGRQPAKECADHDAKYCITYIGYLMGGMMAFRDCMRADLEQERVCTDKVMEDQRVRICYRTCNTNGCNGVPITSAGVNYERLVSGACDMRTETLRCVGLATLWSLALVSTKNVLL